MARILFPLPTRDFDPTEAAVPWAELRRRGHDVCFATPDGLRAMADPRMVEGTGLGPWRALLRADRHGREAYAALSASPEFGQPLSYAQATTMSFDGLVLAGGHAPGMREYLESGAVQALVADAFAREQPVGAICHGVLVVARSRDAEGRSLLHGRQTTALPASMELTAWALTAAWLGRYYRTYPQTVQAEVTAVLARVADFHPGPLALRRDAPSHLERGFTVRDGHYLSARWPGDAHRFAIDYADLY
ncbi:MAG: DJ-1/PfpI family protein [Xanthomonadales bacterium]|nr:DJ-1/PfpI family protein [Xanthomonadales bacterium]